MNSKTIIKEHEREKLCNNKSLDKFSHQIDSSKLQINDMEDRTNYQEEYNRKNNIRINGIEEFGGRETWEQTATMVSSLLTDKLQLPDMELERTHRAGQLRDDRPRPIAARLSPL